MKKDIIYILIIVSIVLLSIFSNSQIKENYENKIIKKYKEGIIVGFNEAYHDVLNTDKNATKQQIMKILAEQGNYWLEKCR